MSGLARHAGFLFAGALLLAPAQWLNHPAPSTPRGPDGKPNLSAKAPRASNGKPDLSGVWQTELSPPGEIERLFGSTLKDFAVPGDNPTTFSKYFLNILIDFKPDEAPIRPAAAETARNNRARIGIDAPSVRCLPQSLPRTDMMSYAPFKIIQTPDVIAVLYELDNTHRQIYTDGRKLPVDPQPTWGGYSVGRWGSAIPAAKQCDFRSASTAATSATWT